jgi:hypothetical protein
MGKSNSQEKSFELARRKKERRLLYAPILNLQWVMLLTMKM